MLVRTVSVDPRYEPYEEKETQYFTRGDGYDQYNHKVVKHYDLEKKLEIHNPEDTMDSTIILDETGSMTDMEKEPIYSVNEYIKGQQEAGFSVKIRIVRFADNIIITEKEVTDPSLHVNDYKPNGMTALFDAVIFAILYGTKPQHCIIITDGKDNISVRKLDEMNALITRAESCGWKFTFIGCTQEAYEQGMQFRMSSQPISLEREGAPARPLFSAMREASSNTTRLNREYSETRNKRNLSDDSVM